jgi:hypothetical protein
VTVESDSVRSSDMVSPWGLMGRVNFCETEASTGEPPNDSRFMTEIRGNEVRI